MTHEDLIGNDRDDRPVNTTVVHALSDIGRAVRRERLARHLTQADLAALLGIGRRFLSELEGGRKGRFDAGLLLEVLLRMGFTVKLDIEPADHDGA